MRKVSLASSAALLVVVAFGTLSLDGAEANASIRSSHPNKAAFCTADISIDKASANVNSATGFLAVLKTHSAQLKTLKNDAPAGALGTQVQQVIAAADAAIASNNPNDLNNAPEGGGIDTYCGVNGSGKPLPKNFGSGKETAFCKTFVPIFVAVGNASSPAGVLAALDADKTQVSELASELSTLPSSIKAKATTTVEKAQTAISTNNANAIQGNGSGAAPQVALYCGQNQ